MSRTLEVETLAFSNVKKTFDINELLGLPNDDNLKPFERMMRIINQKDGDKRITWNSSNVKSIQAAKDLFDELLTEGFVPYVVGGDGLPTKVVMEEFDPFAETISMEEMEKEPQPEQKVIEQKVEKKVIEQKSKKSKSKELVMSPEHLLKGG